MDAFDPPIGSDAIIGGGGMGREGIPALELPGFWEAGSGNTLLALGRLVASGLGAEISGGSAESGGRGGSGGKSSTAAFSASILVGAGVEISPSAGSDLRKLGFAWVGEGSFAAVDLRGEGAAVLDGLVFGDGFSGSVDFTGASDGGAAGFGGAVDSGVLLNGGSVAGASVGSLAGAVGTGFVTSILGGSTSLVSIFAGGSVGGVGFGVGGNSARDVPGLMTSIRGVAISLDTAFGGSGACDGGVLETGAVGVGGLGGCVAIGGGGVRGVGAVGIVRETGVGGSSRVMPEGGG